MIQFDEYIDFVSKKMLKPTDKFNMEHEHGVFEGDFPFHLLVI